MSAVALLADRHALVTGAGGGIGAAIARALAAGGAKVTLVPAGLPEAENVMVFPVGPPVVLRSIVKPAFAPAATVIIVGGAAATLKSTPTPLSEVI